MLHTLFPHVHEIFHGKSDNLPLMSPPHLHSSVRVALDFALLCKLVPPDMPNLIRVPRGGGLPWAYSDSTSPWTPLP
jgi:hypothetical protein